MELSQVIIKDLYKLVEDTCKSPECRQGYRAWTYHIKLVAEISLELAKKLKADEEICEISALLHDYSSVAQIGPQDEHHTFGAKLAQEILEEYDYPQERIEHVKSCIISHRGSRRINYESLEAEIIASADAMAHFYSPNSLLYLAFVVHKMNVDDGTNWVLNKLNNSYNKLMPEAKEMVNEKYDAIKFALKLGIN